MNRPMPPGPPAAGGGTHTLKAVVVIVVLVAIGVGVLAQMHGASSAHTATPPTVPTSQSTTTLKSAVPPPSTTTTTLVPVTDIKLQVLNGVGHGQLATEWSTKLRTNPGYDTLPPDNATSTVSASVIYVITPGYQGEADRLAATVGLTDAAVNPTVPAPASAPIPATERAKANLVLVIGPDLASTA